MRLGSTSEIFWCEDCEARWEDMDSMRRAKRHTKETGHAAGGEVMVAYKFSKKTITRGVDKS